MLLMHGSTHSFVNIRCRVHLAVVKRIQTLLDLLIKLLLAQRSHVKWMPVWKLHLKRNTTLQNDLTQKQADSVGHGNAQLIEYHLSLLFYLGFDSRKYI